LLFPIPALDQSSSQIHHLDLGDRVLLCRLEAYSCKKAGEDRRLFKNIIKQLRQDIGNRQRQGISCETGLGDISQPFTQKLLVSLITSLNASFPDYDFSSLDGDCFERTTVPAVLSALESEVLTPAGMLLPHIRAQVTTALNEAIDVRQCQAYTYIPDADSPLFGGKLWAFTHFLFSPALKRVLLISCASKSKLSSPALLPAAHVPSGSPVEESDYDWDEEEAELALQAQWLSDDEAEPAEMEAVVDTAMLDLEDFTDQGPGFLPDSLWVTPSMQPINSNEGATNSSNSSGSRQHTSHGKPSPFILPAEQNGSVPDLRF